MKKQCKTCNLEKHYEEFVKNKNCKDGYENTCKECKNAIRKMRYELHYKNIEPENLGAKNCSVCIQEKQLFDFPIDLKCVDGRRAICKECTSKRVRNRKVVNKNNLSIVHWNRKAEASNYRINKNKKIGITGTELQVLYNKQGRKCFYCKVSIQTVFHIDHMNPLSKGGPHHIENLCFSCGDCNRLKHTRTHEEFLQFIKHYLSRFNDG